MTESDDLRAAIVALARLEEKVDTLLRKQADIAEEIDRTDKRITTVEKDVAGIQARLNTRLPWPSVTAAIVGVIGVGAVIAERIYGGM